MTCRIFVQKLAVLLVVYIAHVTFASAQAKYKYYRTGSASDISTRTNAGFALMGGGKPQDDAFRWMCQRSNGGDFLIIGAADTNKYDDYVSNLCQQNSVGTLVITSREAAMDPFVADTIGKAEALFIMGGDQANYVKNWGGTPVQKAINDLIRRGVPIGGNSAGLAIMGEFSFSALHGGSAYSKETLADPYNERVTITNNFLHVRLLEATITDTHFVVRDRLGRLLGFMARIVQDHLTTHVRGIAVDQDSSVLLEPDGSAETIGTGKGAYFYRPTHPPDVCVKEEPLTYREIEVYHAPTGSKFNLAKWEGSGGISYVLNVINGTIQSTQMTGALY